MGQFVCPLADLLGLLEVLLDAHVEPLHRRGLFAPRLLYGLAHLLEILVEWGEDGGELLFIRC